MRMWPRLTRQVSGLAWDIRSVRFLLCPRTGGLSPELRLIGAGPLNFGESSVKTGKNAERNTWPSRSLGRILRMLILRNECIHDWSRKCKTLSVVKDFQNLVDTFFCAPYAFPLLLSWWRENQGREDIFQDSCHVSLLLWKSLRFQRPRGNFSPALPSRPFGIDGQVL